MRGILINPLTQSVIDVEIHDFKDLYELIPCDLVQPVGADEANTLWLDEEGLLKADPQLWEVEGQIFAGRTVLLGGGPSDDPRGTLVPLEFIRSAVTFRPDICFAGMDYKVEERLHPVLGVITTHVQTAVYRPRTLS